MSEEQDEELILHAAVLHILDFRTGASVYSEQVLDLEDETVFSYVMHAGGQRYAEPGRNVP